jgi:hypothetical protein
VPFYYHVEQAPATPYTTHGTPNTEDPTLVLRQTTRNCDILSITAGGRAAAATTISGIGYKVRRWTTVGSGGTTVTPAPTRIGTTASTVCVDKASAITAGTVSGAIVGGFVCGKAGPGGWVARDTDDAICLEAGSADEIDINSVAGEASLLHTVGCRISE